MALIAQVYTGRKGLVELCTLIEEGELICTNIILYRRPKAAVAIVVNDLVDNNVEPFAFSPPFYSLFSRLHQLC